jgi:deferrochelatase/peroxidase EfeB
MAKYAKLPTPSFENLELIPDSIQEMVKKNRISTDDKYDDFGVSGWDDLNNLLMKRAINFDSNDFKGLLDEVQANILKPHKKTHAWSIFLHFMDEGEVKQFMSNSCDSITSARKQMEDRNRKGRAITGNKAPEIITFYLTYAGYEFLKIPKNQIPGGDGSAFQQGVLNKITFHESEIEDSYKDINSVHGMIFIADDNEQNLEDFYDELEKSFKVGSVEIARVVDLEKGKTQYEGPKSKGNIKEWFGFQDGASQPIFFPDTSPETLAQRGPLKMEEIAPLGLVLVHDPCGQFWNSCGSYMVWMKLRQNTKAYEGAIDDIVEEYKKKSSIISKELAGAYLMGRFDDGTPVTWYEKAKNKAIVDNEFLYSDFISNNNSTYQNDLEGSRCPLHAHVRKANPRIPGMEDKRIVRRGITYGENPEVGDVGLLFTSFQRNLEAQFEYIMINWLQLHVTEGKLTGQDPIMGANQDNDLEFPASWNASRDKESVKVRLKKDKPLVTFKGGFYMFAPSISFLKNINKSYTALQTSSTIEALNTQLFEKTPLIKNHDLGEMADEKDSKLKNAFIFTEQMTRFGAGGKYPYEKLKSIVQNEEEE